VSTADGQGINSVIPGSSLLQRAAILVLATPAILKSKFFQFKSADDQINIGLEFFYEWARKKVIASLIIHGGLKKRDLIQNIVVKSRSSGLTQVQIVTRITSLRTFVKQVLTEMNDEKTLKTYSNQVAEIDSMIPAGDRGSEPHLELDLGSAIDAIGLKPVRKVIQL
jgi:hypothetical protein